jgi:hypothetical protein
LARGDARAISARKPAELKALTLLDQFVTTPLL